MLSYDNDDNNSHGIKRNKTLHLKVLQQAFINKSTAI